ncbi:hypothetical protein FQR65_LT19928 [Abscondita terminalis]|nr:hypothetical protein FQR65_LT19928 [Abscondita terminalis]
MGALSTVSRSQQLVSVAIKGALDKINLDPKLVDEVLMGNVVQAGVGQAPARQAALYAGLPDSVIATTVNKSSLVAVPQRKGDPMMVTKDEEYTNVKIRLKSQGLNPAFTKEGTVMQPIASTINDGAGAVVLIERENKSFRLKTTATL